MLKVDPAYFKIPGNVYIGDMKIIYIKCIRNISNGHVLRSRKGILNAGGGLKELYLEIGQLCQPLSFLNKISEREYAYNLGTRKVSSLHI